MLVADGGNTHGKYKVVPALFYLGLGVSLLLLRSALCQYSGRTPRSYIGARQTFGFLDLWLFGVRAGDQAAQCLLRCAICLVEKWCNSAFNTARRSRQAVPYSTHDTIQYATWRPTDSSTVLLRTVVLIEPHC